MPTLGDYVKKFYTNYLAPTVEEIKVGKKELKVTEASAYGVSKDNPFSKKLTVEECLSAAEQCPLFMKGARKKAKDSIRAWHKIEHIDKTRKPYAQDLAILHSFIRRNNLPKLWEKFVVASLITGDGYLLVTFENDEGTTIEQAPSSKAVPFKLTLLNSKCIKDIKYLSKEYKDKFIKHYHYEDINNDIDIYIHPNRIIQMSCDELFGPFGNSKINLLRNVVKSSVNIDIANGEILAWFAHGLLDIYQEDMNESDKKMWEDIVSKHPSAYIHKEGEIEMMEPKAIDPKPFFDYIILSIAAAFYMPTHILTGIQVGKVTGAEIGTGDYVKDLKDVQELEYNPLLERIYSMLLKSKDRTFDSYEIVWNPIYIDEMSEAEILYKRVQAADLAFNGARGAGGFIDIEEARRIFNEGQLELQVDKKVTPKTSQPTQPVSPKSGNPNPDETDEEEKMGDNTFKNYKVDIQKPLLDEAAKIMIEKRKAQVEREKKLGEQILKEQKDVQSKGDSDRDI